MGVKVKDHPDEYQDPRFPKRWSVGFTSVVLLLMDYSNMIRLHSAVWMHMSQPGTKHWICVGGVSPPAHSSAVHNSILVKQNSGAAVKQGYIILLSAPHPQLVCPHCSSSNNIFCCVDLTWLPSHLELNVLNMVLDGTTAGLKITEVFGWMSNH